MNAETWVQRDDAQPKTIENLVRDLDKLSVVG